MRTLAALLVLALAAPVAAKKDEKPKVVLSTSDRFPVAGKATTIVTPPTADKVEVVYSPSSGVESKATIEVKKLSKPREGKPYLTVWKPDRPGVVALSAGGQTANVSIRFDGIPLGGVVIMILAGLVLFGGAFVSMRSLMSGDG